ncbi:MAG TPA: ATP-binding protein, partial [Myxococcota bacterium]|nr:ATP-binding protein [Myxococcota bacterium]
DVHEMAEDALSAAVDGLNLTRRLVTVARERQMRPRAVDIGATVGEFCRLLKRLVRRPAELDVRADDGVHAILDRTQLESAVLNLVLNAQHALPSGGRITLTIDTTTAREVGREVKLARVTVRDEGQGMDEETRARATEPFYTTRADSGGTGLGLAMVASFCRSFGGQLQIQSALGVGTSVIMTFPWVPEASPRTQLFPKEAEEKRTPSRRALVVVPDPRLRRYAGRLLTAAGHHVTELEDAAGVVEQVLTRSPDVILLDQPVASQRVPSSLARALGPMSRPLELLAWLALTRPELPIIVTTHDEPGRDGRGGVPEGARPDTGSRSVAMLRKPYSEAELMRILQLLTRP